MKSRLSRAVTAMGLGLSLWITSVAVLAAPQTPAQTKGQDQPSNSQANQKDQKAGATQPAPPPANRKPLSTNEDPTMIGKRNINKGLWGRLAAGTESEVRAGRQLAAEVDKESKFIDDPIITEYVNRVGQNIVLHSDAKVPFTIKVIDSDEVNAFALPGGFFYVNKGLILAADNEAELAGVMAHEIGHVAARHYMEMMRKDQAINIATLAGILFGGAILGNILYNGGGFFEGMAMLKFNVGREAAADRLGRQSIW